MLKISITSRANTTLNRSLSKLVSDLMTTFTAEARQLTPQRTGTARRGWRKKGSGKGSYSENTVPYIGHLDEGTTKMPPANGGKGIVDPAITETKRKLR